MELSQEQVARAAAETLAGIDSAYRDVLLAETTTAANARRIRDEEHVADLMQDIAASRRYAVSN